MSERASSPVAAERVSCRRRSPALLAIAGLAIALAGCGADSGGQETGGNAAGPAAAGPPQKPERLTVYVSLGLTGSTASAAQGLVNAATLALEEAGGQAGGRPVRLQILDDGSQARGSADPAVAAENARAAARDNEAIAYLGDQTSSATLASLPILNRAGILQLAPTVTYPYLTQDGGPEPAEPERYYPTGQRTFGRIIPSDLVQSRAQAQLLQALGCTRVHVLRDGSAYGRGLSSALARTGGGVTITRTDQVDTAQDRFGGAISAVTGSGADCVAFNGNGTPNVPKLFAQLHAALPNAKLVTGDDQADFEFTSELGQAGSATYITFPTLDPRFLNAAGLEFEQVYAQRFGGPPEPATVYGYETMRAILAAIDGAGAQSNDRAAVVASFYRLRDRESALGTYSITETGDSTLALYGAYRVEDGDLLFDRVLDTTQAAGAPAGG